MNNSSRIQGEQDPKITKKPKKCTPSTLYRCGILREPGAMGDEETSYHHLNTCTLSKTIGAAIAFNLAAINEKTYGWRAEQSWDSPR
jgi:hypothetical protein